MGLSVLRRRRKCTVVACEVWQGRGIYPIGSGNARPLREYIEIIRDEIDPNLPLGFGEVPYSDKQVMHLCADISDLQRDTGFEPEVGFREGIQNTIKYCLTMSVRN